MAKKSFFERITGVKKNAPHTKADGLNSQDDDGKKSDNEKDASLTEHAHDWTEHNYEGQLSVDVYQTEGEIVIKSAVAGVDPDDLDISISNDMITIKGSREMSEIVPVENYFYQECYFGPFSRSIILPHEVDAKQANAEFKKGILTIRLPKSKHVQKIHIKVDGEEGA